MKSPLVAIVIPAFNKSYLTNLCLDSIYRARTEISFKVIVIDNNSTADDFQKVKTLVEYIHERFPDSIMLIRNDQNLGFSKAINQGMKAAFDDKNVTHICLLNNDIIVTDFWLDDLTKYAQNSFVGPVCNSVGNEQIIGVDYKTHGFNGYTTNAIRTFAKKWRDEHIGNIETTEMLGFFCVLGPRKMYEEVGYLDEAFGLGYYEDDDYCIRVQQKGYKQIIVRQTFLHHWGSASFKDLSVQSLSKLFSTNLKKFKDKHGVEPVHHGKSWVKSLFHEHAWRLKSNMEVQSLYDWEILPGYFEMRQEFFKRLQTRIEKKVRPLFISRLLVKLVRFMSLYYKGEALQKYAQKKIDQTKGRFFEFPMGKIYMKRWTGKTIVVFPIQKFSDRMQRPQQVALQLASAGYNVLWIDPDPNKEKTAIQSIQMVNSKFVVLRLSGLSYANFYTSSLSVTDANKINKAVKNILGVHTLKSSVAIFQSPFWYPLDTKSFQSSIYDCMDAHDAFGSATLEVRAIEEKMIKKAEKIVTSSSYLHDKLLKEFKRESTVIRNACAPQDFNCSAQMPKQLRKTIGYFGAVAEWFDAQLLLDAVNALPEYDFVIVGNTTHSKLENATIPANMHLAGEIPYKQLPDIAAKWSAAIIPFQLSELILATNPVKLYEYYALGLPVVSTKIPEVVACPIPAYIAENGFDFAQKIRAAIDEDSEEKKNLRKEYAKAQTWNQRALEFIKQIETNPC